MNNPQLNLEVQNKFKKTSVRTPSIKVRKSGLFTILNINLKLGFRNPAIITTGVIFTLISFLLMAITFGAYTSAASNSFSFLVFDIFITFLLGLLITLSCHYYFRKQITEGIHNIELRGGINSLTSFWMRVLCQQIIVLTYISMYVISSAIVINTSENIELLEIKTRYYIWLTFIYFIEIFITAISILIFSFSTSAVGVLLSILVTILFSTTNTVWSVANTFISMRKTQNEPVTLSSSTSIGLNALFGKQIYEEFKNDKDIGFLFTDGNGDDLYKQLGVESLSDFQGENPDVLAREILLSGLVYDNESNPNYVFKDDPYAPNINKDGTIINNPKIVNSQIYKAIFEKILNNVNKGQYISKFDQVTDVLMAQKLGDGPSHEIHTVNANEIVDYLLKKPEVKELHHLLSFIKNNLKKLELFTTPPSYVSGSEVSKSIIPFSRITPNYNTDNKIFGKNTDFYSTMPDLLLLNFYIMSIWKIGMFLDTTVYLPDYIVQNKDKQKVLFNKLEKLNHPKKQNTLKAFNPLIHFSLMRTSSDPEVNLYYDNAITLGSLGGSNEIFSSLNFEDKNKAFTNALSLKSLPYELLLSKSRVELKEKGSSDFVQITNYDELIKEGNKVTLEVMGEDPELQEIFDPNNPPNSRFTYSFDNKKGIINFKVWQDQEEYEIPAMLNILINGKQLGERGEIELIQLEKSNQKPLRNSNQINTKALLVPSFTEQVKNSIYKTYNPKVVNYYSKTFEYTIYSIMLITLIWIAFFIYKKKSKI